MEIFLSYRGVGRRSLPVVHNHTKPQNSPRVMSSYAKPPLKTPGASPKPGVHVLSSPSTMPHRSNPLWITHPGLAFHQTRCLVSYTVLKSVLTCVGSSRCTADEIITWKLLTNDHLVLLLTNKVRVPLISGLPIPRLEVLHDIRHSPQRITLIQLTTPELLLAARLIRNQRSGLGMRFMDGVVLDINLFLGGAIPVHMAFILLLLLRLRRWRCHRYGSVAVLWVVLVVDGSGSGFSSL